MKRLEFAVDVVLPEHRSEAEVIGIIQKALTEAGIAHAVHEPKVLTVHITTSPDAT